jgi:hypothetical protein
MWGGSWPKDSGIDAVALGLAAIALVPWIADFLSSAKLPGAEKESALIAERTRAALAQRKAQDVAMQRPRHLHQT